MIGRLLGASVRAHRTGLGRPALGSRAVQNLLLLSYVIPVEPAFSFETWQESHPLFSFQREQVLEPSNCLNSVSFGNLI